MSQSFQPGGYSMLPPVVKNLLIINGIAFLATIVLETKFRISLNSEFGMYFPLSELFRPYQVITHMFLHGSMGHLIGNMFALWMFGSVLENAFGPKRFLTYYFVTGLGAAVLHMGVNYIDYLTTVSELSQIQVNTVIQEGREVLLNSQNYTNDAMAHLNFILNTPTIGASGAVFGILLGFGVLFPNTTIYLFFAIPIKAKYFVMAYGALELYLGVANNPGDNIAHFAHLGGMIFGYLMLMYWKRTGKMG